MPGDRSDIRQDTLDLMVLKTLNAMGLFHGYGIARRIEQLSEDVLRLNQGAIYAALLRLISLAPDDSSLPPRPRTGSGSPA